MPRRREAPRAAPVRVGLDDPDVVDSLVFEEETGAFALIVSVPRPWDDADTTRLKKKIGKYLAYVADDGLSERAADWYRGPTRIVIQAAEMPPPGFAPLWERYAYTLREQYGLGFQVVVLQGANQAEALVEAQGYAGHDAHGAMRGGTAFAAYMAARFEAAGTFSEIEIVDGSTLRFMHDGAASTLSLDRAWREARGKGPAAVEAVGRRYVAVADDTTATADGDLEDAILPVLRPIARVAEMEALMAKQRGLAAPEIHEPFSNDIVLSYVIDREQGMASLSPDEAAALTDGWADLHDLAVGNLFRKIGDQVEVHTLDEGVSMVVAGGSYEAGLLCVAPVWAKLAPTVRGDVIAAVPSRDLLLFAGSEDAPAVASLRMRASELHGTASDPVAPGLLRLTKAGWVDA